MVNIHNIGTHMRVIDIILNEALVNTPDAVAKAEAIIARINSFLNPADPNRLQILDPDPKISKHALSAEKLDADTADTIKNGKNVERSLRHQIEKWEKAMVASKDANDGQLSDITKKFNAWLRRQENVSVKAAIAYVNPIDVYNTNVTRINQLLNGTTVKLFDKKGFEIPLSWLTDVNIQNLETYVNTGKNLVQQINNKIPTVNDPVDELTRLNKHYRDRVVTDIHSSIQKRQQTKGLDVPKSTVKFSSIDEMKQLGTDIVKFLKLPTTSTKRLFNEIDFNRSNVTADDITKFNDYLTQIDSLDSTDSTHYRKASRLKDKIMSFLTTRQGKSTSTWAVNRQGQGRIQQLGELPIGFDSNNPLHAEWKNIIEVALYDNNRRDVSGVYKEYWDTVNNIYNWKCYLSKLDLASDTHSPYKISIDRIDSNVGYEPSNVAFCCAQVNTIKGNLLNNELVALCKQILKHNGLLFNQINENTEDNIRYSGETGKYKRKTLRKIKNLAWKIIHNFADYMYTYEVRRLSQIESVIDKELMNPTSLDYVNFLTKSTEITRIYKMETTYKKRVKKYNSPAECLLKGIQNVHRFKFMSLEDFKNDAVRIVKFQPNLKPVVHAALKDALLYYRDVSLMGEPTKSSKHSKTLNKRLLAKYREYRTSEREGTDLDKYKTTVSYDKLVTIAKSQGGKCAISGIPFSVVKGASDIVSIDRIDSQTGGYSENNVQLVLRRVNSMKNDISMQDFLYWCLHIYNNAGIEVTDEDLANAVLHAHENDTDEEVNDEVNDDEEVNDDDELD
jgi:hypothetical protein